jgi:hypothetical protein
MAKTEARFLAQVRAALANKRHVERNPVPPSSAARIREGADLFKQFTGHDAELQDAGDAARELGLPIRRNEKIPMLAFGELLAVEYETVRDGKTERYRHSFRKESRPLLAARHDGKRIFIVGGRYRFTDRGITDA